MKRLFSGLVLAASLLFANPTFAQAVISVSCGDTCPGSAVVLKNVYVKNVKTWVIKNPHGTGQKLKITIDGVNTFKLGAEILESGSVIYLDPGENKILTIEKKDAVINLKVEAVPPVGLADQ